MNINKMSSEPVTFAIPDSLCYRAGVSGTWKSINTVALYANTHPNYRTKDEISPYGPADAYVHHIRREVIIFDPNLRKLVNESLGTFLRVRQVFTSEKQPINKSEQTKLSRQYRSIIRACLENLEDVVRTSKDKKIIEAYSSYLTIFYAVECLWHLSEILYIEQIVGEAVVNPLLSWIRFHLPEYEANATRILVNVTSAGAEDDDSYWDTVLGVFLQGRIDIVRALLKLHTATNTDIFREADAVLVAMPIYDVYGGVSITDFQLHWKHWQMDTLTKIESKYFIMERNLDLLMKLAVGNKDAWEIEGRARCQTWYSHMACHLLYTEPYIKRANLGQYALRYFNYWPRSSMKHLDHTIMAVMQQDIHQVLHEIQQMSENGWFAAHFIDLLYHCGELKNIITRDGSKSNHLIQTILLQDYGVQLMDHPSLWQVGAEYLAHSGKDGLKLLELMLERISLKSEARTAKILQVAQKYKFHNLVNSICKQRARLALRRNRPGHALGWALKSKDSVLASQLADSLLRSYCKTGDLYAKDLLDSLGSSMLVSERLIFLGKYFEFHKVYKAEQFKEAAALLVSLVASKLTPKYFWDVLFRDALPLLESSECVLSSNDTYELLHCIEQNATDDAENVNLLRLAVARNLARSLTHEIQTK